MPDDRTIAFSEINEAGETLKTRVLPVSAIDRCPHVIMVPEHYRDDESCRCDEVDNPVMAEWGYTWDTDTGRWV